LIFRISLSFSSLSDPSSAWPSKYGSATSCLRSRDCFSFTICRASRSSRRRRFTSILSVRTSLYFFSRLGLASACSWSDSVSSEAASRSREKFRNMIMYRLEFAFPSIRRLNHIHLAIFLTVVHYFLTFVDCLPMVLHYLRLDSRSPTLPPSL
jgi:hypothetical protein